MLFHFPTFPLANGDTAAPFDELDMTTVWPRASDVFPLRVFHRLGTHSFLSFSSGLITVSDLVLPMFLLFHWLMATTAALHAPSII
jgi:hypothetical protein